MAWDAVTIETLWGDVSVEVLIRNSVCEQVGGLRFVRVTRGQVLLVWSDGGVHSKYVGGQFDVRGGGARLRWAEGV